MPCAITCASLFQFPRLRTGPRRQSRLAPCPYCECCIALFDLLQLLFTEFFQIDEGVLCSPTGAKKFVHLKLQRCTLAILGVLYQKDQSTYSRYSLRY